VIGKSIEMTVRSQTLPRWLWGGKIKTTENKIYCPRWAQVGSLISKCLKLLTLLHN
jgi:hypothetical protein